jgi:hypothetical protein
MKPYLERCKVVTQLGVFRSNHVPQAIRHPLILVSLFAMMSDEHDCLRTGWPTTLAHHADVGPFMDVLEQRQLRVDDIPPQATCVKS